MTHPRILTLIALLWLNALGTTHAADAQQESSAPLPVLTVEPSHPWRPPFGLERVGQPPDALVTFADREPWAGKFVLVSYHDGKEVGRQELTWVGKRKRGFRHTAEQAPPYDARVALAEGTSEVALLFQSAPQSSVRELARQEVRRPPSFEGEAIARPDRLIHPVDLGTIFVPADWLLLAGGQKAEVTVAALDRGSGADIGRVNAWFESEPGKKVTTEIPLAVGRKPQAAVTLEPCSLTLQRDVLHVVVASVAGAELWRKRIPVMIVPEAPRWPRFGAVATKLRYDGAIPVNGKPSINYEDGWKPELQDVVVCFPNCARFVFWRGASYCPFWASRSNTGFCYEWAEILSGKHIVGKNDCAEPLQDKELRYGRVEIVENTAARVHLRWSYQSCDLDYKVWGDFATEDFYFYPDGMGTRAMTLTANPNTSVETDEFIIFTPPSGYPLDCLPPNLVDILWNQGKAEFRFPFLRTEQQSQWNKFDARPKDAALLYRIRIGKSDPLAAIHYSPRGSAQNLPAFFSPFYDRGALVTPMYWGSHWPISRGFPTGISINDRIHEAPAHNSVMNDGTAAALRSETAMMRDAQGKTKMMKRDVWAWLIGMTDAGDDDLRQWAQSFSHPPSVPATTASMWTRKFPCPPMSSARGWTNRVTCATGPCSNALRMVRRDTKGKPFP